MTSELGLWEISIFAFVGALLLIAVQAVVTVQDGRRQKAVSQAVARLPSVIRHFGPFMKKLELPAAVRLALEGDPETGLALAAQVQAQAQGKRAEAARGLAVERFTRAVDQLGQFEPEKLPVRVGGIYALEQIALGFEELRAPVIEVLAAFLRENSVRGPAHQHNGDSGGQESRSGSSARPRGEDIRADLKAVITVLKRSGEVLDSGDGIDLRNVSLPQVNLNGAQLKRVDFAGAQLLGASFDEANLESANFQEAQLQGASFRAAHLERTNFTEAQLDVASFEGAQLRGASFRGAQLQGATFEAADLQGASLTRARLVSATFREAHLENADLRSTELRSAILDRANLWGANLDGADLGGASLKEAQLEGVSLRAANLQGANLSEAGGLTRSQLESALSDETTRLPLVDPHDGYKELP